jgi:hypothetical protein
MKLWIGIDRYLSLEAAEWAIDRHSKSLENVQRGARNDQDGIWLHFRVFLTAETRFSHRRMPARTKAGHWPRGLSSGKSGQHVRRNNRVIRRKTVYGFSRHDRNRAGRKRSILLIARF